MMERTFSDLGLPVEPTKTDGQATVITILGLELDTQELIVRLPQERLGRLQTLLAN